MGEAERISFVKFLESFARFAKRKSAAAETELERNAKEASEALSSISYFKFTSKRPNHSLERIKKKAELLREDDPREWNRFLPILRANIGKSRELRKYYDGLIR